MHVCQVRSGQLTGFFVSSFAIIDYYTHEQYLSQLLHISGVSSIATVVWSELSLFAFILCNIVVVVFLFLESPPFPSAAALASSTVYSRIYRWHHPSLGNRPRKSSRLDHDAYAGSMTHKGILLRGQSYGSRPLIHVRFFLLLV
jgi:hypothetical protein